MHYAIEFAFELWFNPFTLCAMQVAHAQSSIELVRNTVTRYDISMLALLASILPACFAKVVVDGRFE